MKTFSIRLYLPIVALALFTSCDSASTQVENKLNELLNKTEALDSLINHEVFLRTFITLKHHLKPLQFAKAFLASY
jgi:hypothetical protein